MTPAERARALDLRPAMTPYEYGLDMDTARQIVADMIREAVAAEREACAQEAINHADRNRDFYLTLEEKAAALREALQHAASVILSYQLELRNSNGVCGIKGSLADAGFCQGSIYKQAIADINKKAGEEIYPV